MSHWTKKAQVAFNAYIRERDILEPCISCGKHDHEIKSSGVGGKWDCNSMAKLQRHVSEGSVVRKHEQDGIAVKSNRGPHEKIEALKEIEKVRNCYTQRN